MRLVLSNFMTLDGVCQAPGGKEEDTDNGFAHGGWSFPFFDIEVMGASIGETIETTKALLFGRRTWQGMAAAWPSREGDSSEPDVFTSHMNSVKKYCVTSTLTDADMTWNNSSVIPGTNALDAVRDIKAQGEGDLQVLGSLTLARALISADLVDEYQLMIEPVLVGGGKRLFPDDGVLRTLELVDSVTAKTGVQICHFRPVR